MGKSGDILENNAPQSAVRPLACDDPDLQSIKAQIATADPKLRSVLEDYVARWFQHSHTPAPT